MNPRVIFGIVLLIVSALFIGSALAQEEPTSTPVTIEVDVEEAAQSAVELTESAAQATANVVTDLVNRLTEVPRSDVVRILFVIGGVLLLVAGWRIYEFIILLAGILIGASVGAALVGQSELVLQVAAALVGGLIGAVLAIFLYYLAVFFIGAYVGIILTNAIAVALGAEVVSALVLFIGALIGGLLLLALSIELLILLAVVVGAQLLVLGLGLGAEWILIFIIVGVIVQLMATRYYGYNIRRRPRRLYWPRRV
jgi:hypothetical protein